MNVNCATQLEKAKNAVFRSKFISRIVFLAMLQSVSAGNINICK